jgi:hypothetical protein
MGASEAQAASVRDGIARTLSHARAVEEFKFPWMTRVQCERIGNTLFECSGSAEAWSADEVTRGGELVEYSEGRSVLEIRALVGLRGVFRASLSVGPVQVPST